MLRVSLRVHLSFLRRLVVIIALALFQHIDHLGFYGLRARLRVVCATLFGALDGGLFGPFGTRFA